MRYKAILFDLDGTLLPMDMGEFCQGYFSDLYEAVREYGIDQATMMQAMGTGIRAMAANEGCNSNDHAFWNNFEFITGLTRERLEGPCDAFYGNEFKKSKRFTQDNPFAIRAVQLAHEKAEHVVLATNPYFPEVGVRTRMEWVGLKSEDFDFFTHYKSENYCKPNPKYYLAVCKKIGVAPGDCLMIGNDVKEDMQPASRIGMDTYLVTDWMIPDADQPWEGKQGSFQDLLEMLENL